MVRGQDARRDPEGGAGKRRAVRADLHAGGAARDRAVCRPRLPRGDDASRHRQAPDPAAAGAMERPLLRTASSAGPRTRGARGMKGPLAGARVLDFGLLTAGANTSAMLADLGADVIKIESGAYLDPFRVVGKMDDEEGWWNRSPQFRFTNRNKRGLALNLKDPEGQRVIRELAKHCDVVVENLDRKSVV